MQRIRSALRLLTAALPLALAAPLGAQSAVDDAGTFRILVEGREVGTEEFQIRQTGVGANAEVVATGRVRVALPSGSLELTPRLRASGLRSDPVAYEIAIGGDSPRRIVGSVGSGRFSARIASPTGEQLREYVASAGATILDEGVAHHYFFVARRTRDGQIPVLIPRENRQAMATVRSLGEERVEVGGAAATLYRLSVTPAGGDERHVWVDALGRVIRVEIPARAYVAVRTELPR